MLPLEVQNEVPWVDTLNLHDVPWINNPQYTLRRKTVGERITCWFISDRDPDRLEWERRIRNSMGLFPNGSLSNQMINTNIDGVDNWEAADFFRTMTREMFMEGPKAKGWADWCKARDAQLHEEADMGIWNRSVGLDGRAG